MHDNHRCMQSLEIYFLRYNKVYVIEFQGGCMIVKLMLLLY